MLSERQLKKHRKVLDSNDYNVASSQDAARLSESLESIWSEESMLTQKILIYIASLLEKLIVIKNEKAHQEN